MLCPPVLISDKPALVAQATAPLTTPVTGVVIDRHTGRALTGVYVSQVSSVQATFTGEGGKFSLALDPSAARTLSVSVEGYERAFVPVGRPHTLRIALLPIKTYMAPKASLPRSEADAFNPTLAPLPMALTIGYRLSGVYDWNNGATTSGLANNNFSLAGRVRLKHWLIEVEGSHMGVPVDVSGLATDQNPAFTPSTYDFGARVGYVFPLCEKVDTALALGYRYRNTVPNNGGVPYIGNGSDFEQTRQALGISGEGAYLPSGPWRLTGELGLYPLVFAWAKAPGQPFGNSFYGSAGLGADYLVRTGLRLGVGYQFDGFFGNGGDTAHMLMFNLVYSPNIFEQGPTP